MSRSGYKISNKKESRTVHRAVLVFFPRLRYTFAVNSSRSVVVALMYFMSVILWSQSGAPDPLRSLEAFSDVREEWGEGIEAVIEAAYRECFRTYLIDGRFLTIRMPFGENNERAEFVDGELNIRGGGKADPVELWAEIEAVLVSKDFSSYLGALSDGREKLVIYDLERRSWTVTRDLFETSRMRAGAYPGLPHRPYVHTSGEGAGSIEVYNYLYCVGRLGMDCSGFVWHVLSSAAARYGIDLARSLRKALRAPTSAAAPLYFGTRFFEKPNPEVLLIPDEIRSLKPLDVLYFRGSDGGISHSAVIQSIDRTKGVIRYLQSTDEAPLEERGVHESFIFFDPAYPQRSLKDPSVRWTQKRYPPFDGERASAYTDDGQRYRAHPERGGGGVARLRLLAKLKGTPGTW